jgi:hypothetical protein
MKNTFLLMASVLFLASCGELSYKRGATAGDLARDKAACSAQPATAYQACMVAKGWSVQNLETANTFETLTLGRVATQTNHTNATSANGVALEAIVVKDATTVDADTKMNTKAKVDSTANVDSTAKVDANESQVAVTKTPRLDQDYNEKAWPVVPPTLHNERVSDTKKAAIATPPAEVTSIKREPVETLTIQRDEIKTASVNAPPTAENSPANVTLATDQFMVNAWWKMGAMQHVFDQDSAACVAQLGEEHTPDNTLQHYTAAFLICMREQGWKAMAKPL